MKVAQAYIVVGGGVVGTAIALRLQAAGRDVTLVDHGDPRRGASFGNIGHIAAEQGDPMPSSQTLLSAFGRLFAFQGPLDFRLRDAALWAPWTLRFVAASRPRRVEQGAEVLAHLLRDPLGAWARLTELANAPADLVRASGHAAVWLDPARAAAGQKAWASARTVSAVVRPLEASELDAYDAVLAKRPAGGVAFEGTGQVSEPIRVVEALLEAFRQGGGRTVQARVTGIQATDPGVLVQLEDGGAIVADALVVAAGAWSGRLLEPLGVRVPLLGERGYSLQSPTHDWPDHIPLTVFEEFPLVLARFTGGLRASSHVEFGDPSAPADPRKWRWIEDRIRTLGVSFSATPDRWCGPRPTLPDYLPAIGRLKAHPQILYAFGHQHLGLTLAAETAEQVEGLVSGRASPAWLESLTVERFGRA